MSSTENKEIKIKKSEKKEKVIDKESFEEIKVLFRQYWKVLFLLIGIYILSYLAWHQILRKFVLNDDYKGKFDYYWVIVSVAVARGLLFTLDGFVSSLLKTPFNQMCYTINKTEGIKKKQREYIITKATESNEHCKETLKKFGILSIGLELIAIANFLMMGHKFGKEGIVETNYELTLYISYIIPLIFSAIAIFSIYRELQKIERSLKIKRVKKSS